jgi:RNA polymerase sigma-70 factor (ECF subfamily)
MPAPEPITDLLGRIRQGDKTAFDELMPLVYPELHRIAERYFRRERRDHTLQPTALVNETYLRLVNQQLGDCQNRIQFLGVAALLMRRILVNHARDRQTAKRGNSPLKISLDDAMLASEERADELLAIDEALRRLAELDAAQAQLVEMHFFGGMSFEEAAEALGISPITAKRRWASARAWLITQLAGADRPGFTSAIVPPAWKNKPPASPDR